MTSRPLIQAEVERAYYEVDPGAPPLDLHALGRPFAGLSFPSPRAFRERLLAIVRETSPSPAAARRPVP
ncbi:MAG: hypothetical protein ACRD12_20965 [Acidimicrobiales bacterium]